MRDKEVLRLEIAVDDALVVGGAQSLRELESVVEGLRRRHRPSAQTFAQRRAPQQFGNDKRLPLENADVMYYEHVRVFERARRARLLLESA